MPESDYVWLPRKDILTFEEISSLVDVFTASGVNRVRLTGGEPLLRKDLPQLIHLLAEKPALSDLALTTNGILLTDQATQLLEAGLHRLTVSLDTLQEDRFTRLTRFKGVSIVQNGLAAAKTAGFNDIKIDTVIIRGVNDDELIQLLDYARSIDVEIRFIEYMDVGGATRCQRKMSSHEPTCYVRSRQSVVRSTQSTKCRRHRQIAFSSRTDKHLALSRQQQNRSAAHATVVA